MKNKSNMTKTHSPGPWRVEYGHIIYSGEYDTVVEYWPLKDNPSDAALIAAAPELLEACKELKMWRDKNDPVHTSYFYLEKIMAKVELAIAKAEGNVKNETNG